uniref:Junctophilin n=1 Tax=Timema bartmani TaxID=61472 RepID=A0A7R9EMJ5_9NEOP|nr:unnamed protein product [Timema bartmani]
MLVIERTYQGQWLRGMRHGYGVRASAPFGLASHYRPNKTVRASMTSLRSNEAGGGGGGAALDPAAERDRRVDDSRGGFVLKARSDEPPPVRRRGSLVEKSTNIKKSILSVSEYPSSGGVRHIGSNLKIKKQRSTGDLEKKGTSASIRSTGSTASWVSTESSQSGMTNASIHTDSNASFVVEDEQMDPSVTETYMGEWKNDKRAGFGISERSDGLRYEGEWFANKKYGYGVTTFKDGSKEEGKYKNNVLITSQKKKHIFLIRSAKFRERIDAAVNAAQRASKIALQKADIAISRTATARGKAELADMASDHAREDSEIARVTAKQFAPDFQQPGQFKRLGSKTEINDQGVCCATQINTQNLALSSPRDGRLLVGDQHLNAPATSNLRRNSKLVKAGETPAYNYQQAMNDRFDHYKRPPSRDSSVDRYTRATGRMSIGSRQSSVDKAAPPMTRETSVDRTVRAGSGVRGTTPAPPGLAGNGAVVGPGVTGSQSPLYNVPNSLHGGQPPFEEVILRKRGLGQDIIPSPGQPKRTESLYITPAARPPAPKVRHLLEGGNILKSFDSGLDR